MNNPKKILFIVEMLNGRGGMENVTCQLINMLNLEEHISAGLFIINYHSGSESDSWMKDIVWGSSTDVMRNPKVTRLFHTLRLAWFLKKNKPEHIIALNTVPCLIAHRAISLSGQKITLSSWMHLPPKYRYRPRYLTLANHHFAISEGIKQQLIELGAKDRSIDVVFNPVKRSDSVIPRSEKMKFLYVGRVHFEDQKQLKDLFDAVSQLDFDWSLDIVGDGPDSDHCKKYTVDKNISDKVFWHGWQDDSWDYVEKNIKSVTCLLLTSNNEGFPLVLLEAISRGVYCISSDCISGPSEIIKSGVNGQLYQTNNSDQLAEVLKNLNEKGITSSQDVIKDSVSNFYESSYIERFKKIINDKTLEKK